MYRPQSRPGRAAGGVDALVGALLPWHDAPEFIRAVSLCQLRGTPWAFLAGAARSGAPPPRSKIADRCRRDPAVLAACMAACRRAASAATESPRHASFFAALVADVLAGCGPGGPEEALASSLVQAAAWGLGPEQGPGGRGGPTEGHRAACWAVLGMVCTRAQLRSATVEAILATGLRSCPLGVVDAAAAGLAACCRAQGSLRGADEGGLSASVAAAWAALPGAARGLARAAARSPRGADAVGRAAELLAPGLAASAGHRADHARAIVDLVSIVPLTPRAAALVASRVVAAGVAGWRPGADSAAEDAGGLGAAARVLDARHPEALEAAVAVALRGGRSEAGAPTAPGGSRRSSAGEAADAAPTGEAAADADAARWAAQEWAAAALAGTARAPLVAGVAQATTTTATIGAAADAASPALRAAALGSLGRLVADAKARSDDAGDPSIARDARAFACDLIVRRVEDDVDTVVSAALGSGPAMDTTVVPAALLAPALGRSLRARASRLLPGNGRRPTKTGRGGSEAGGTRDELRASLSALCGAAARGGRDGPAGCWGTTAEADAAHGVLLALSIVPAAQGGGAGARKLGAAAAAALAATEAAPWTGLGSAASDEADDAATAALTPGRRKRGRRESADAAETGATPGGSREDRACASAEARLGALASGVVGAPDVADAAATLAAAGRAGGLRAAAAASLALGRAAQMARDINTKTICADAAVDVWSAVAATVTCVGPAEVESDAAAIAALASGDGDASVVAGAPWLRLLSSRPAEATVAGVAVGLGRALTAAGRAGAEAARRAFASASETGVIASAAAAAAAVRDAAASSGGNAAAFLSRAAADPALDPVARAAALDGLIGAATAAGFEGSADDASAGPGPVASLLAALSAPSSIVRAAAASALVAAGGVALPAGGSDDAVGARALVRRLGQSVGRRGAADDPAATVEAAQTLLLSADGSSFPSGDPLAPAEAAGARRYLAAACGRVGVGRDRGGEAPAATAALCCLSRAATAAASAVIDADASLVVVGGGAADDPAAAQVAAEAALLALTRALGIHASAGAPSPPPTADAATAALAAAAAAVLGAGGWGTGGAAAGPAPADVASALLRALGAPGADAAPARAAAAAALASDAVLGRLSALERRAVLSGLLLSGSADPDASAASAARSAARSARLTADDFTPLLAGEPGGGALGAGAEGAWWAKDDDDDDDGGGGGGGDRGGGTNGPRRKRARRGAGTAAPARGAGPTASPSVLSHPARLARATRAAELLRALDADVGGGEGGDAAAKLAPALSALVVATTVGLEGGAAGRGDDDEDGDDDDGGGSGNRPSPAALSYALQLALECWCLVVDRAPPPAARATPATLSADARRLGLAAAPIIAAARAAPDAGARDAAIALLERVARRNPASIRDEAENVLAAAAGCVVEGGKGGGQGGWAARRVGGGVADNDGSTTARAGADAAARALAALAPAWCGGADDKREGEGERDPAALIADLARRHLESAPPRRRLGLVSALAASAPGGDGWGAAVAALLSADREARNGADEAMAGDDNGNDDCADMTADASAAEAIDGPRWRRRLARDLLASLSPAARLGGLASALRRASVVGGGGSAGAAAADAAAFAASVVAADAAAGGDRLVARLAEDSTSGSAEAAALRALLDAALAGLRGGGGAPLATLGRGRRGRATPVALPRTGPSPDATTARRSRAAHASLADALRGLVPAPAHLSALRALAEAASDAGDADAVRRALTLAARRLANLPAEAASPAARAADALRTREERAVRRAAEAEAVLSLLGPARAALVAPTGGGGERDSDALSGDAGARQAACVLCDAAAKGWGADASCAPAVAAALPALAGAAADPRAAVRGSALVALASCLTALGPASLEGLPTAAAAIGAALAGSVSAATEAARRRETLGPADAAAAAAACAAAGAVLESVPGFVSPYLGDFLPPLLSPALGGAWSADGVDDGDDTRTSAAASSTVAGAAGGDAAALAAAALASAARKVAPRHLLPALNRAFPALLEAGPSAASGGLALSTASVGRAAPAVAATLEGGVVALALAGLGVRAALPGAFGGSLGGPLGNGIGSDDNDDSAPASAAQLSAAVAGVEGAAARLIVAFSLKLDERRFRGVWSALLKWAGIGGGNVDVDDATARDGAAGVAGDGARRAGLFVTARALALRLRAVFAPHVAPLVPALSSLLASPAPRADGAGPAGACWAASPDASASARSAAWRAETAWRARFAALRLIQAAVESGGGRAADEAAAERLLPGLAAALGDAPAAKDAAGVAACRRACGGDADVDAEEAAALQFVGADLGITTERRAASAAGLGPGRDALGLAAAAAASALASQALGDAEDAARLRRRCHAALLRVARSPLDRARLGALTALERQAHRLGVDYLPLLPEALPALAELVEDPCPRVEARARACVLRLESLSGEGLGEWLKT